MFRLARTDGRDGGAGAQPHRPHVQLAPGLQPFGRGVLLGCEDKRVSRQHGQLEVTDTDVKLTALHQNPCFVIKKNSTEMQLLRQGASEKLTSGDKFGLLPNAYWYELVHGAATDVPDAQTADVVLTNGTDSQKTQDLDNQCDKLIDCHFDDNMEEVPAHPSPPSQLEQQANQPSTEEPCDEDDEQIDFAAFEDNMEEAAPQGSGSPSLLDKTENTATGQHSTSESTKRSRDATDLSDASPAKVARTASGSPARSTDPPAQDEHEDVKPSTSTLDAAMGIKQEVKEEPASGTQKVPVAQNRPGRERCMYGAQCYRRNAQHKLELSHPGDADWVAGAQGVCPWGAGCVRRDPRHWRDHTHPPGTRPPLPGGPGRGNNKKPRQRKNSHSESSEEGSPEELAESALPAKRVRKPVKRVSWSGSESGDEYDLEDPFLTDGSDDWQPSEK